MTVLTDDAIKGMSEGALVYLIKMVRCEAQLLRTGQRTLLERTDQKYYDTLVAQIDAEFTRRGIVE